MIAKIKNSTEELEDKLKEISKKKKNKRTVTTYERKKRIDSEDSSSGVSTGKKEDRGNRIKQYQCNNLTKFARGKGISAQIKKTTERSTEEKIV